MGNVAINVLLTMLADSVLTGVLAFFFSTVVITALGEIGPQAYFSRNAYRAVAIFAPALRFYRILLWPIAKPTALLLDAWVGTESVPWFRERELHNILRYHAVHDDSEVGRVEAIGAINFLTLDDPRHGGPGQAARSRKHRAAALQGGSRGLTHTRPRAGTIPSSASWRPRARSGSCSPMTMRSRACC